MSAQHHILITEDNQDLITIYSAKLQAEGYSVATASDGKEAFDRIREGPTAFYSTLLCQEWMAWSSFA